MGNGHCCWRLGSALGGGQRLFQEATAPCQSGCDPKGPLAVWGRGQVQGDRARGGSSLSVVGASTRIAREHPGSCPVPPCRAGAGRALRDLLGSRRPGAGAGGGDRADQRPEPRGGCRAGRELTQAWGRLAGSVPGRGPSAAGPRAPGWPRPVPSPEAPARPPLPRILPLGRAGRTSRQLGGERGWPAGSCLTADSTPLLRVLP